ncbi:MAG: GNAT family N-acetyltransferase [Candidatus Polarisedimenticolia bacterium]
MRLLRLDNPDLVRTVAAWLACKENYQWLDFGNGRQILTPEWLAIAAQRDTEILRVFTSDDPGHAVGVVGLTNVDRTFRTARIWAVAGDKAFGSRGYATRAAAELLTFGFRELGLEAVNTWCVEGNPSVRIVERLGFRAIGRQRRCHLLEGEPRDRLWYDLLASEHRET